MTRSKALFDLPVIPAGWLVVAIAFSHYFAATASFASPYAIAQMALKMLSITLQVLAYGFAMRHSCNGTTQRITRVLGLVVLALGVTDAIVGLVHAIQQQPGSATLLEKSTLVVFSTKTLWKDKVYLALNLLKAYMPAF